MRKIETICRILILLLAVGALFSCGSAGFTVNEIKIRGAINSNVSSMKGILKEVKGKNLIIYPLGEIVGELSKDPYVDFIRYEKVIPDILIINVYEKRVSGYCGNDKEHFSILEDGTRVSSGPKGPIYFTFPKKLPTDNEIENIIQNLYRINIEATEVEIAPNYLKIVLADGFLLLLERDISNITNVKYMQYIREKIAGNEGDGIVGLDMRYRGQSIMILGGK
ncbi:hypothetical protein KAR04_00685 [Candidatus Calescamantes bacterium]|nr:hypothetical protein [Candidatus Calescamantes bacterium]MCK5599621.1 hypothetical protein [bacterium]